MRRGRLGSRVLLGLLAAHWAWSGLVYHWGFFRPINPAATWFGAAFVGQAVLFAWLAAASRHDIVAGGSLRSVLGGLLLVYGIVYPALGVAFGLQIPRIPLFAVPCPMTLVTAGWLIAAAGLPRVVSLVPMLWAVVGSTAAFALGISADLALVAVAVLLALNAVVPSALGGGTVGSTSGR